MVLSDTQLPPCFGNVETQLPCSPSQLLQTDAALETLRRLDAHDSEVSKEVGDLYGVYSGGAQGCSLFCQGNLKLYEKNECTCMNPHIISVFVVLRVYVAQCSCPIV